MKFLAIVVLLLVLNLPAIAHAADDTSAHIGGTAKSDGIEETLTELTFVKNTADFDVAPRKVHFTDAAWVQYEDYVNYAKVLLSPRWNLSLWLNTGTEQRSDGQGNDVNLSYACETRIGEGDQGGAMLPCKLSISFDKNATAANIVISNWAFERIGPSWPPTDAEVANIRNEAEHGDTKAQIKLGQIYRYGNLYNFDEAFKFCRMAADKGDALGQLCLGDMYERGWSVKPDFGEAYFWYSLSANALPGRAADTEREEVAWHLSDTQISEINKRVRGWKPTSVGSTVEQSHPPSPVKAQISPTKSSASSSHLNQPATDDAPLLSWAAQAATDTMTFGYDDYDQRLQQSSRNFTTEGWTDFYTLLQRSQILGTVQSQKLKLSARVKETPELIQKGADQGKYVWTVQMWLAVDYKSSSSTRTHTNRVTLMIEKKGESPTDWGIEKWIAQ